MTDLAKAKALFRKAGLAFPCLPVRLASSLNERGKWIYSTRPIDVSPYDLNHYVNGAGRAETGDYAVLAHSGHGVNSYAIQYYLVCGPLQMFLFLGWGGVYMDAQKTAENIRQCFSLADRIAKDTQKKLRPDGRLMVVVSDFYGNYWSPHHDSDAVHLSDEKTSQEVLGEVLTWLHGQQSAGA
ncbi:MAG: hypothetical protein WC703_01410 [Candidatus Neomarinimicrobiota bacterium]